MKICSIENCGEKHHANGYCANHNYRMGKYGSPEKRPREFHSKGRSFLDGILGTKETECVQWPFARKNGYGQIRLNGKMYLPSRLMCIMAHGNPPTPKHEAAHSCGKGHEGCVNPNHLRWATSKENSEDALNHGTIARGEKIGKVTESQARFMIENRGKIKQKDIALMLGVPKPTVCQIQKGKSWKWLTDLMSQENESRPQSHPAP